MTANRIGWRPFRAAKAVLINRLIVGLAVAVSALTSASRADAERVQWLGNGHWYEAVLTETNISWDEARDAASSQGGYLASIESAAENEFVFSLVDSDEYWLFGEPPFAEAAWGPWLGGYQLPGSSEPDGGWTWLSGDPWVYTNWDTGQPDNSGAGIERFLHFHSVDGVRAATWNDYATRPAFPDFGPHAYVIEFVPEPSTFVMAGVGFVGLLLAVAKRRRSRKVQRL